MKKERILLPKPQSSFLLVQCTKCGKENVVYSSISSEKVCPGCGEVIAKSTGGLAVIEGNVIRRLDE
ncbi:MAG: 30S ribosomal protein S27e [Nitrososphaerales archaeon]